MEMVEDLVAATPQWPANGSSSSLESEGSHQTDYTVTNGDFKEGEIIDTNVKSIVQYDINEDSVVDKILEDNKSDLEGHGQPGNNNIVQEDDNNGVLKGKGGKKHIQFGIEGDESEDDEVEEVELEFENAVPKLHTHNAYCPNCDAQITKVVLRRKIPKKILTPSLRTTQQPEEERQLVGCLSCFSIFMPQGKTLHPFPLFGGGDDTNVTGASSQQFQSIPKSTPKEIGCDPFVMFRRKEENVDVPDVTLPISTKQETPPLQITSGKSTSATQEGDRASPSNASQAVANVGRLAYETLPLPSVKSEDMSIINIRDIPGTSGPSTNLLPITEVQSNSPEIVKSIIYGGLAESITSLSVVSSAAASGAETLNIIALGLANVIGGLIVLAQNLSNLKNDQQEEKYKEALGQKENFFLHAIIAMISYLVFGLVPPIVYGFTFQDTDDKDFKLLAVAAASLICIIFLAIGKAYITQAQQFHKFSTYLSYVVYYVATAALASGVGYAVGDQAKKVLEKYAWLLPKDQAGSTLFFHGSQTLEKSFASY